jgi:hypothetical protein
MFRVKWIARFNELNPIEVEGSELCDVEQVMDICKGRLATKRLAPDPPDGFLICDHQGKELRRWLTAPLAPRAAIVPSKETAHLPSRRRRETRRKKCTADDAIGLLPLA